MKNTRDAVLHETFYEFYEPKLSFVFQEKFETIIRDLRTYAGRSVAAETLWNIALLTRGPIPKKTISEKDYGIFIKRRKVELKKKGKIDSIYDLALCEETKQRIWRRLTIDRDTDFYHFTNDKILGNYIGEEEFLWERNVPGGYLEVGCLMNYALGGYLSHYYQWFIPLQKEQEEEKFDNKEFIRRLLDRCELSCYFLNPYLNLESFHNIASIRYKLDCKQDITIKELANISGITETAVKNAKLDTKGKVSYKKALSFLCSPSKNRWTKQNSNPIKPSYSIKEFNEKITDDIAENPTRFYNGPLEIFEKHHTFYESTWHTYPLDFKPIEHSKIFSNPSDFDFVPFKNISAKKQISFDESMKTLDHFYLLGPNKYREKSYSEALNLLKGMENPSWWAPVKGDWKLIKGEINWKKILLKKEKS